MRISMPRGDVHYIDFTVSSDKEEFQNIDYTEIYFTVKRKYTDAEYILQKRLSTGGITKIEDNKYRIKINPEDTNNLIINKQGEWYDCDIEVEYNDGNELLIKSTTMGEFVLTRETTWASNEG